VKATIEKRKEINNISTKIRQIFIYWKRNIK